MIEGLLRSVPKDVWLLIYRRVHELFVADLNAEYYSYFHSGKLGTVFSILTDDGLFNWRDKNDPTESTQHVFRINIREGTFAELPILIRDAKILNR